MKFKNWLKSESLGSPILNGGIDMAPGENLNTSLPVRSKYVANDTYERHPSNKKPEKSFGFDSNDNKSANHGINKSRIRRITNRVFKSST